MSNVTQLPVKFPLWKHPEWKNPDGSDHPRAKDYDEYFDRNGKYVGIVEPYGTIWAASIISGGAHQVTPNSPEYPQAVPNLVVLGHYYTKEQAKDAVESNARPVIRK